MISRATADGASAYLYLIDPPADAPHAPIPPDLICVSGDSAGANAVLALLVILRDQKLPMPAGASLISPWVDLTHSFPSLVGPSDRCYIPPMGFHYKPSLAWPPIAGESILVNVNGKTVELTEQIQLYCSNRLLSHPLVSFVNQGSLGGLCPTYVTGGSGELLTDEQIARSGDTVMHADCPVHRAQAQQPDQVPALARDPAKIPGSAQPHLPLPT